ncbi:MAG: helix-turn-helix domain-containing protein [Ruminococcus sp.]|nr:helix-turn-helix domain-containing protein [Ruminococcus sp.]
MELKRTEKRMDYNELGRRIAMRRRELGLKQADVNEAAGLSDKYLSNIERASSIPSLEVLMKLCDVLDTTPDFLLLGAGKNTDNMQLKRAIASKCDPLSAGQLRLISSMIDWIIDERL